MTPVQLQTLLIEHGLDEPGQIRAAKTLGVHPRTVRHWLAGDRHIPLMVDRVFGLLKTIDEYRTASRSLKRHQRKHKSRPEPN
jgi:hypothetical protein